MTITHADMSTKTVNDKTGTKTHVTINWEGMEQADLIALAQQTLIIKLQAKLRRDNADGTHIPATWDVTAIDHKVGIRAAKKEVNVLELVGKMTPEQRAQLLESLKQ